MNDGQRKRDEHGHFLPGVSGNPGGYAKGVRNRLNAEFLRVLADDFKAHGKDAIKACREDDPAAYVRALAGLLPKEIELTPPLGEFGDDELVTAIRALQSFLAARGPDEGTREAGEPEKAH